MGNRRNGRTAGKVRVSESRLPVVRGNELRAIEEPSADEIGSGEFGAVQDGLEEIGASKIGAY